MSNANYMRVDPDGFKCLDGHKVTVETADGTPWKCGEPSCWYYDGVTTNDTPAPTDSRSDELDRYLESKRTTKLNFAGISVQLLTIEEVELRQLIRRRELESRINQLEELKQSYLQVLQPSPSRDFVLIGDLDDRINSLQAELDKLTEGRGE